MTRLQIICAVALILIYTHDVNAQPEAAELTTDLLSSYIAYDGVRPVHNASSRVTVKFGLALIEILNFDTDSRLLHVKTWERYLWKDEYLVWEPSDYNDLNALRINPHLIWRPDIKLYNSASFKTTKDEDSLAVVYSDGSVLWVPSAEMKVTCHPWEPDQYDNGWHCPFKFGSWTFDGFKLDVDLYESLAEADLSDFVDNPDWSVMNTTGKKNTKYYPCCAEPYPDLTFDVFISGAESSDSSE